MIIIYIRIFSLVRQHQRGVSIKAIPGSGITEMSTCIVDVPINEAREGTDKCPKCSAGTSDNNDDLSISILSEEIIDDDDFNADNVIELDPKSADARGEADAGVHVPGEQMDKNGNQKKCIITLNDCFSDGKLSVSANGNPHSDIDKENKGTDRLVRYPPTSNIGIDKVENTVESLEESDKISDSKSCSASMSKTGGAILEPVGCNMADNQSAKSYGRELSSTSIPSKQRADIRRSGQVPLLRKETRMHRQLSNPVTNGIVPSKECTCDNRLGFKNKTTSRLLRSNTIGAGAKSSEFKKDSPTATIITRFKGNQRSLVSSTIARQFSSKRNHLRRTLTVTSEPLDSIRFKALNQDNKPVSTLELTKNKAKASANQPLPIKAIYTTLIILVTYIICYMPTIISLALTCSDSDLCLFPQQCLADSLLIAIGASTHLGIIMKSIVDPFIYYKRVGEIKSAIDRYILKRRSRSAFAAGNSTNASQRTNYYSTRITNDNKTNSNSSFSSHLHRHRSLHNTSPKILKSMSCKRVPSSIINSNIPYTTGNGSKDESPVTTEHTEVEQIS